MAPAADFIGAGRTESVPSRVRNADVATAMRESRRGVMIDFHDSNTWADPAHQTKHAARASHTVAQLQSDIYSHTKGILDYLKANGVTVTWVQVGNEINSGMPWPEGKVGGTTN